MHGRIIMLAMAAVATTVACNKSASSTGDTGMVAAPESAPAAIDRHADEAAIVAADSAWLRHVMAKNVDSLMTYYTPDAVSFGFGSAPASGTDQLRASYTEMVKATMNDPKLLSNTVKISDDGKMAYDYGTYSMTVTPPGGKPTKETGGYLNVWRKVDGQWKLAAEMSTPVPAPKS
jgi:uncharacterized protein (TIGR02246 family)